MIRRLLLPLMVMIAGACSPAFAEDLAKTQKATKNIVNPYDDESIPEMKPLTEDDVRAIFGSMIETKLAPLRDADVSHEARLAKLEAFMLSGGRLSSGGSGSTGSTKPNVYEKSPAVARQGGGGSTGSVKGNVYYQPAKSHWTFPGSSIEQHLKEHGYNTPSMTDEQRLAFHDSLHEEEAKQGTVSYSIPVQSTIEVPGVPQITTSYSRTVSNPLRKSTVTSTSSCPGGVCPVPQSRSYAPRARLFGR